MRTTLATIGLGLSLVSTVFAQQQPQKTIDSLVTEGVYNLVERGNTNGSNQIVFLGDIHNYNTSEANQVLKEYAGQGARILYEGAEGHPLDESKLDEVVTEEQKDRFNENESLQELYNAEAGSIHFIDDARLDSTMEHQVGLYYAGRNSLLKQREQEKLHTVDSMVIANLKSQYNTGNISRALEYQRADILQTVSERDTTLCKNIENHLNPNGMTVVFTGQYHTRGPEEKNCFKYLQEEGHSPTLYIEEEPSTDEGEAARIAWEKAMIGIALRYEGVSEVDAGEYLGTYKQ